MERVTGSEEDAEPRIAEYWDWAAVALYLPMTVDLLTTVLATGVVGVGGEANPPVAWFLARSVPVPVAVNLGVVVLAAALL